MIILTPCPKNQQKTTKTPKEFGNGSLWKKAEPPLLHYCSPAGLISEERKQGPVPGWTLPIVEAAEFGKPNPTISLPRLSAEIHPPTLQPVCWDSYADSSALELCWDGRGLPLAQGEGGHGEEKKHCSSMRQGGEKAWRWAMRNGTGSRGSWQSSGRRQSHSSDRQASISI